VDAAPVSRYGRPYVTRSKLTPYLSGGRDPQARRGAARRHASRPGRPADGYRPIHKGWV